MGVSWHPRDGLTVDVAYPGYGYLEIDATRQSDADPTPTGLFTISGPRVGQLLRSLTAVATQDDVGSARRYDVDGLWSMPVADARMLLQTIQAAVVYAAAGSDRSERLLSDQDPDEPQPPICANCPEGQRGASGNPLCEQHGHVPFGELSTYRGAWQRAQQRYNEHKAAVGKVIRLPRRDR
jgi:hypothetical protein